MSTVQAHCHWCTAKIYAESVFKVKCFWNHKWSGYPICGWCSKGLKTDGQSSMVVLRKELGLETKVKKEGLMRWIDK